MCCATTPATVLISLTEVPPLIPLWWEHLALFLWPGFNFFKPFQSAPLHSWEALQVTNSANDIQHYSRHDVCLEISSTKQLSPTNVNPTFCQGSGNEHNKPRFFGGKLPLVQSPVELFFSTRNLTTDFAVHISTSILILRCLIRSSCRLWLWGFQLFSSLAL